MKEAHTVNNKRLNNGKWEPFEGMCVGQMGESERINGGLMYTAYSTLFDLEDGRLVNPANGDVLNQTRKDKESGANRSYFSKVTGVLVNVWHRNEHERE